MELYIANKCHEKCESCFSTVHYATENVIAMINRTRDFLMLQYHHDLVLLLLRSLLH